MKILYIDRFATDFQKLKDQHPTRVSLMGARICFAEFVSALLHYGSYDRILFPAHEKPKDSVLPDRSFLRENDERIQFVDVDQLSSLSKDDHIVLASLSMNFPELTRIRRLSNHIRAPITGIVHSLSFANTLQDLLRCLMLPMHQFDAIVCTSRAGHETVKNYFSLLGGYFSWTPDTHPSMNIQTPTLPLGIDTGSFAGHRKNGSRAEPVVMYFGRFSHTSKADLLPLIITFAELLRGGLAATLVLAGDDTQAGITPGLHAIASALGHSDRIRIVPNPTVMDKYELYRSADVFVSPVDNLQETFGLTLLEAMAAGLPVVASDWDGYRDLVVDGETGYLIPTYLPDFPRRFDDLRAIGNMRTPDPLAATTVVDLRCLNQALAHLLKDPGHRRQLGEGGRRRAQAHFDWSKVIPRYEDMWSDLVTVARSTVLDLDAQKRDLMHWSYQQIFGHYATGFVSGKTVIRITHLGRKWRHDPELIRANALGPWFEPEILLRMLDALESSGEVSVATILDTCSRVEANEFQLVSYVYRLLKYGLAEADMYGDHFQPRIIRSDSNTTYGQEQASEWRDHAVANESVS